MQKIKVLAGFPGIHASLAVVNIRPYRHAGSDRVKSIGKTGQPKGVDVISQVQFIPGNPGSLRFGTRGCMFEEN